MKHGEHEEFIFLAETKEDKEEWMEVRDRFLVFSAHPNGLICSVGSTLI